jgi:CRISPR-associated protein Csb1
MSTENKTPTIDLTAFKNASRLLINVKLKVADGTNGRFQPTGFPDLGPALYKGVREFTEKKKDGGEQKVQRTVQMLFSDTAAALGNWLEEACLSGEGYNEDCAGIPYVRVLDGDGSGEPRPFLTSSVREPHRLASPYVLSAKRADNETMKDWLKKPEQLAVNKQRPVRTWTLAQKLFNIDPGCILHGVFLEELDGRLRLPRLLSGYIEAANPNAVNYGGVYRGEVTAKDNIPFSKQEFTSDDIQASFILHLATLQGYGLTEDQNRFLILWALYKVETLLNRCLRLRSGCMFQKVELVATLDGKAWEWPTNLVDAFKSAKQTSFTRNDSDNATQGEQWTPKPPVEVTWSETDAPVQPEAAQTDGNEPTEAP